MNTATTIYRIQIALGKLIVPAYPTGSLWALDELADYYPRNQAAEVMRAKVLLRLGIHHTDADSVRVTEILTHAELHERGQSRIPALRLLESRYDLAFPRYLGPECVMYLFDDRRSVQMWSQLHAGVMADQVGDRVLFRALVDDERGNSWLVLVGCEHLNPTDDADDVFAKLPEMLSALWGRDIDGIHAVEVQALSEVQRASRLRQVPIGYLWEYPTANHGPYYWPDSLTEYGLIPADLVGYVQMVREGLGVTR